MTILERLERWKSSGMLTAVQYSTLADITRKERFSVFFELNALLYVGVLSLAAGTAWMVRDYVATLGDTVILSSLSLLLAVCFVYCFSRGLPFSTRRVDAP